MKATLSDRLYLTGLSDEQTDQLRQSLTFRNPKYDDALQFGRSTWSISVNLELFEDTPHCLAIPRGHPLRLVKRRPHHGKSTAFVMNIIDGHTFGLAAYKKRFEIYQQQGFEVLSSSKPIVSFYSENKEVYPMQKDI